MKRRQIMANEEMIPSSRIYRPVPIASCLPSLCVHGTRTLHAIQIGYVIHCVCQRCHAHQTSPRNSLQGAMPPGEFNGMISGPLAAYSESFITKRWPAPKSRFSPFPENFETFVIKLHVLHSDALFEAYNILSSSKKSIMG